MGINDVISLPREVVKLSKGICSINEEVLNQASLKNQVFSPPANWVWTGERPVITEISPSVDNAAARGLFNRLLELLAACKPEWTGDAERLKALGEAEFCELVECTIKGDMPGFQGITGSLGTAPEVAGFILFHTVRPFLKLYSEAVNPVLDTELWMESFCPVCGGAPAIARVESGDGRRYLRCGSCDTEWLFRLLSCPRCGNDDHSSLAFLRIEETPGYELHVCESCGGYIKAVNERNGGDRQVMEDETATVYLDLIAEQRGYRTETGNA
ncbi:formate dehydrogenase accessory protein FdhE [Phosphitispora fastidiosa]|uniref:formate dehydrogenase accessory protein FdhE n=1 Tax=Phosphitispora fastidiosa TaxID=2837202 RepID=UPI001E2A9545|nr:formate dehydrogenase accessory protein FdhE [Phosphitispora fastidiosa]MBU7008093.1 FdhE protein [Phosphitispora fastidiosa]